MVAIFQSQFPAVLFALYDPNVRFAHRVCKSQLLESLKRKKNHLHKNKAGIKVFCSLVSVDSTESDHQ